MNEGLLMSGSNRRTRSKCQSLTWPAVYMCTNTQAGGIGDIKAGDERESRTPENWDCFSDPYHDKKKPQSISSAREIQPC
ncbi:uncharacterized [Tachysurus ichikawai]